MKISPYILILISLLLFCESQAQNQSYRKFQRIVEKIKINQADTLLQLRYTFIVPQSEEIEFKSRSLNREVDYQIDYRLGIVRLSTETIKEDSIRISYRILPIQLKPNYQFMPFVLWQPKPERVKNSANNVGSVQKKDVSDIFENSQLRRSGSLTRSISVGNRQGLQVESGLRLQLEGKITSDVHVVAMLSDQNIPIQPEGNTQTLQEIDKVYIQIRGPKIQAQLGDFNLKYSGGRFGNYNRKLQGAMLQYSQGSGTATVSGAVSKGKFQTQRFTGQEGLQGPYQLQGSRGESEIIVLSGTERVWVDGEPMIRGDENDYVIDYGNGQITFTRKRLITGDSRIEVDFEFSDFNFQRNLYSAHLNGIGFDNKLKYNVLFIREADDPNNLLEVGLNDQERIILENLGDETDSAFVESGRFVGPGKGNYTLVDSLGQQIYQFAGNGLGDYLVQFTYKGVGNGEYSYAGQGRYRFTGLGNGNYSPKRILPIAQSQNLTSFYLQFDPNEILQFSGEFALSLTDRNLMSALDDNDNLGSAFQIQARISPRKLQFGKTSVGSVQLSGLWREKGKRFFELSRDEEVEYDRKWDLSANGGRQGEKVRELNSTYLPFKGGQLRLNWGDYHQDNFISSRRLLSEFSLKKPKFPEIQYREESIHRSDQAIRINGDWFRRLGSAQYRVWRIRPFFRYEGENKKDISFSDSLRTGFNFDDFSYGIGFKIAKPLEISIRQNLREDQQVTDGGLQDYSRAEATFIKMSLKRWRNLQLNLELTNRKREFVQSDLPEKRTRLTDFVGIYSPWKKALQADLRVRMSNTQISKTEQFYFKVDEGRGNFRFEEELNEYVPDIFGDFILRTLATGEFEPVNELLMNAKIKIKPQLLWGKTNKKQSKLKRWLSSISWLTYFSFDEKSRRDSPWKISFGGADKIFPDEETVFGRYLVRQDLNFFENVYTRSLRIRWLSSLEKNNRLTGGGQESKRNEISIRFKSKVSKKYSLETTLSEINIERLFESATRVDRKILSRGGKLRLSYRPKSVLEIAADLKFKHDLDRVKSPGTSANLIGIKPNFSYALRGRGRLRGEIEFSKVTVKPSNAIIPYEMVDGRREGRNFNWLFSFDYRASSRVMILFSYLGRQLPGRDELQHIGKVEVKAYF